MVSPSLQTPPLPRCRARRERVGKQRTDPRIEKSGRPSASSFGSGSLRPTRNSHDAFKGGRQESQAVIPRHYADVLRSAFLAVVSQEGAGISGSELATMIAAIEAVQTPHTLESRNEFTRHLATADAVNAVVEIAHDMRSPLTSILFLVETLRRGRSGPVTTVQERQLGLIYGAALGLLQFAGPATSASMPCAVDSGWSTVGQYRSRLPR